MNNNQIGFFYYLCNLDIEFFVKFHQPVGLKELADDAVLFDVFLGEKFLLEKVHLFRGLNRCRRFRF